MTCTRCNAPGGESRYEHAERVLCDRCAAKPPLIDWQHPPAPPDPELLRPVLEHAAPLGTLTRVETIAATNGTPVELPSSWAPVDLSAVLEGRDVDPPPTRLHRMDGVPLLYPAKLHTISGEPESCKGWFALAAAAEAMADGESVLYVDFEDAAAGVVGRLLNLGVDPDTIRRLFVYVRPTEPLDANGWAALDGLGPFGLAIIDGITEAMTLHGLSPDDNADVARWRSLLPRPLAAAGATVLEIDHVTKNADNRGKYAIGAQHKLSQLDGASYGAKVIDTFGRGRNGKVKIICHKDRGGHLRPHEVENKVIAVMRLASTDDSGAVTVTLEPPDPSGTFRPTHLMQAVSELVEAYRGIGKRRILEDVKGKDEWVHVAVLALVSEGYITVKVDGQTHTHHSVKQYREGAE